MGQAGVYCFNDLLIKRNGQSEINLLLNKTKRQKVKKIISSSKQAFIRRR
jgi:hypothetical protein